MVDFLCSRFSGELLLVYEDVLDAPRISLFLAGQILPQPCPQVLPFGIPIALCSLEVKNLNPPAPVTQPNRNRFWFRALLLLLVLDVLWVALFAPHPSHRAEAVPNGPIASLQSNWQTAFDLSTSASPESRRAVFPYSVIPGGVRDADELRSAAAKDPVVAKHYSDFRIARAHTIRLDRPTAMFVSYRMNNHVYWTRNRITIPAGETLISDGKSYARVRCGNRLSPIAALPVSIAEPPAEKLETPGFIPPLLANLMPSEEFGAFPFPNALSGPPVFPGGPIASGNPRVGFPPILPPGTTPPGGTIVTPPPPVAAPEPGALALLFCAAFLFMALRIFFRK